MPHQYQDKYGAEWYKYYDGIPPLDDDNDYRWTGWQWVTDNWEDEESDEYDN